jgi:hypothetical protein
MNFILHVIGARFAGKTNLLTEANLSRRSWAALDFYRRHNVLDGADINWKRFHANSHKIIPELHGFISRGGRVIESSGINMQIELYLYNVPGIIRVIALEPPSDGQLRRRCHATGANYREAVKYNSKWMGKFLIMHSVMLMSYQDALSEINHIRSN